MKNAKKNSLRSSKSASTSPSTLISLKSGQFKMIDNRKREKISLVCSEGTVWVTAAGDETDYVLRAGQVLELGAHTGNVLLQSISQHVEVNLRSA